MVWLCVTQDNSGTIEREEFLSLPQISSNPLATRSVFPPPCRVTHFRGVETDSPSPE
jgi:hypothetical protein